MKTLFTFLLLISISFSQAQTSTEKYNSYLKRYEYFNSKGSLIGYKKYNSYLKQWEYTEVNSSNSTTGYYDNIPVYEPNYELINKALATNEAQYNSRLKAAEAILENVGQQIMSNYGKDVAVEFVLLFDERSKSITDRNGRINVYNDDIFRRFKNIVRSSYIDAISSVQKQSKNSYTSSRNTTPKTAKLQHKGAKIRELPNPDSRLVYETQDLEVVTILEEYSDSNWMKVRINNKVGYITNNWIKNRNSTSSNYSTSQSSSSRFKYTGAKLRSQPNVDSALVYTSNSKESVRIIQKQKNSNWVKVEVNGKVGYITENWIE